MTDFWQPSFDPMNELIQSRQRIKLLETNQHELIKAQNDLGQQLQRLFKETKEMVKVMIQHKQEIERLNNLLQARSINNNVSGQTDNSPQC